MIEGCPGAFTREEIRDGYLFLAAAQREDGCMPDRVRGDGKGVYSPGGEAKPFSKNGSVDQSPFMVILCHQYWKLYGDLDPFRLTADRLQKAMRFTPRNPSNGLVTITDATVFRPYSFLDTVPLVGDEQFSSVLFWDACMKLAEMFEAVGQDDRGAPWRLEAERVRTSIATLWDDRCGVFVAASEKWRQPSVWGSLFAVYSGIATPKQSDRIARWCLDNYDLIVFRGQIRHLPKGTFWGRPQPEFTVTPSTGGFQHLVREESWTEKWPDADGKLTTRTVTAQVWTAAMQATLDTRGTLRISAREKPYYLDGPIILKSGQKLVADPKAEIRLKPGCNTCMVRNESIVGFADRPVPEETIPDTDIQIQGGIWTTLATAPGEANGNLRGGSSRKNPVFGTHGVFLLHNVKRVTVKNVTVRQSKPFAIHFGNAHDFLVDGLVLDDHRRDGVHINGPASDGIVRRVNGVSHDDPVALNAWEWKNYAPSYGPIRDMLVEDVTGTPDGIAATNSIRLLPGVKRFDDGTTLACPLENITLRRITDIHEFKLYDQPNLELGRDKDFSIGVGTLKNIRFEDLTFNRPGVIEVHADTDGLAIQNVKLHFPVTPDYHLLAIGPKSQTYKYGRSEDPARWTEIFSPDHDCTVRNLTVSGVHARERQDEVPIEQVVRVIKLKPNPDYPKTTPRGGTGKGIWIR